MHRRSLLFPRAVARVLPRPSRRAHGVSSPYPSRAPLHVSFYVYQRRHDHPAWASESGAQSESMPRRSRRKRCLKGGLHRHVALAAVGTWHLCAHGLGQSVREVPPPALTFAQAAAAAACLMRSSYVGFCWPGLGERPRCGMGCASLMGCRRGEPFWLKAGWPTRSNRMCLLPPFWPRSGASTCRGPSEACFESQADHPQPAPLSVCTCEQRWMKQSSDGFCRRTFEPTGWLGERAWSDWRLPCQRARTTFKASRHVGRGQTARPHAAGGTASTAHKCRIFGHSDGAIVILGCRTTPKTLTSPDEASTTSQMYSRKASTTAGEPCQDARHSPLAPRAETSSANYGAPTTLTTDAPSCVYYGNDDISTEQNENETGTCCATSARADGDDATWSAGSTT